MILALQSPSGGNMTIKGHVILLKEQKYQDSEESGISVYLVKEEIYNCAVNTPEIFIQEYGGSIKPYANEVFLRVSNIFSDLL